MTLWLCGRALFFIQSRDFNGEKWQNSFYDFNRARSLSLFLRFSLSLAQWPSSTVNSGDYNSTVNCPAAHNAKRDIKFSTKLIHGARTKRRYSNCLTEHRCRRRHLHCMCPESRAQHTLYLCIYCIYASENTKSIDTIAIHVRTFVWNIRTTTRHKHSKFFNFALANIVRPEKRWENSQLKYRWHSVFLFSMTHTQIVFLATKME